MEYNKYQVRQTPLCTFLQYEVSFGPSSVSLQTTFHFKILLLQIMEFHI